jgi:hypothetical protein
VQLVDQNASALASASGRFQFPNTRLELRQNDFSVRVSDVAGNTRDSVLSIERLDVDVGQDPVLVWNQAGLEAVRLDAASPLTASTTLKVFRVAVLRASGGSANCGEFAVAWPGISWR